MLLSAQNGSTIHNHSHQPAHSEQLNNTQRHSAVSTMPGKTSVSTNTGKSLLWHPNQSSDDTTEHREYVDSVDNSLVEELSPLSSCISIHQEGERTHSITSSVHAVDLQSFNGDATEMMSSSATRDKVPGESLRGQRSRLKLQ